jgi:tripartite-type tricarboxylate transporter receptor subunit TctC
MFNSIRRGLKRLALTTAAVCFSMTSMNVWSQSFPNRPITIIVPIAAGGSTDVLTRMVAAHMSKTLGQPVVVENVSGAGGIIGSAKGARSPADGYTLVAGSSGSQASSYSVYEKMPYTPDSFSQIGLTAIIPALIVVTKSLPVTSLQELIAYAKANPGKVSLGNPGVGTSGHLQCEFFKATTGADFALVPYRGAGPMINDLISGQIQGACDATPSSSPAVQGGYIRAIATLGSERANSMPDIATTVEQGMPQLQAPAWIGLAAPKGTPQATLLALEKALSAALDDPTVRAGIQKLGANVPTPKQRGLKYTDDFVRDEVVKWAVLAKAANLVKQ